MSSYPRTDRRLDASGSKDHFAPEFRLTLLMRAHWPLSDGNRRRSADSPRVISIGPSSFEIVDRNQMLPLAHRNLRDALPEGQHEEWLDALRKKAVDFASHSLSQAAELIRMSEAARRRGHRDRRAQSVLRYPFRRTAAWRCEARETSTCSSHRSRCSRIRGTDSVGAGLCALRNAERT